MAVGERTANLECLIIGKRMVAFLDMSSSYAPLLLLTKLAPGPLVAQTYEPSVEIFKRSQSRTFDEPNQNIERSGWKEICEFLSPTLRNLPFYRLSPPPRERPE